MQFSYELTSTHLEQFKAYYHLNKKQIKQTKLGMTYLPALVFVVLIAADWYRDEWTLLKTILLLSLAVSWVVFYPRRFERQVTRHLPPLPSGLYGAEAGVHQLELLGDNLHHTVRGVDYSFSRGKGQPTVTKEGMGVWIDGEHVLLVPPSLLLENESIAQIFKP